MYTYAVMMLPMLCFVKLLMFYNDWIGVLFVEFVSGLGGADSVYSCSGVLFLSADFT